MPRREFPGPRTLIELLAAGALKIATSLLRRGWRIDTALGEIKKYFPDGLTRSLEAVLSRARSANDIARRFDQGRTGRTGPPQGIPVDPTLPMRYRYYFTAQWINPRNGELLIRTIKVDSDVWLNQDEAIAAARGTTKWTQDLGNKTIGSPKTPKNLNDIAIKFTTILQSP